MRTNPLIFYISPQWKQDNISSSKCLDTWHNQLTSNLYRDQNSRLIHSKQTSNKIKDFILNSDRQCITINLNTNEDNHQNIKTAKDLTQIFKDFQTYRNQLHDTHGSIHIQIDSSQSNQYYYCYCCNPKQSIEICKKISKLETELFQNDFVKYIN